MKSSVLKSMTRALVKLRYAETMDELSYRHGDAAGFVSGVFCAQDELMIEEWNRMSALVDNAWRCRIKELVV